MPIVLNTFQWSHRYYGGYNMTIFVPGMKVKKIFHPKLNKLTEFDYVERITKKGFIIFYGNRIFRRSIQVHISIMDS